jgi:ribosome-interacting GTPase 1
MIKLILLLLMLPLGNALKAQSILLQLQIDVPGQGHITINQDENLTKLLLNRIDEIKNQYKIPGFRILIFSDYSQNSLEKATQARAQFREKYNYPIDYVYNAPDSKLYIGNFRTKSEAQKALNHIKRDFPKAFVKPDMIDLPDLE